MVASAGRSESPDLREPLSAARKKSASCSRAFVAAIEAVVGRSANTLRRNQYPKGAQGNHQLPRKSSGVRAPKSKKRRGGVFISTPNAIDDAL